jgi:hypothetical protein
MFQQSIVHAMYNSTLDHPISSFFLFEQVVVINTFKWKELMLLLSWSKTFRVMISFTGVLAALGHFDYRTDLHRILPFFKLMRTKFFEVQDSCLCVFADNKVIPKVILCLPPSLNPLHDPLFLLSIKSLDLEMKIKNWGSVHKSRVQVIFFNLFFETPQFVCLWIWTKSMKTCLLCSLSTFFYGFHYKPCCRVPFSFFFHYGLTYDDFQGFFYVELSKWDSFHTVFHFHLNELLSLFSSPFDVTRLFLFTCGNSFLFRWGFSLLLFWVF